MNPIAEELWEEGVAIDSFRLVSQGRFEEEGVKKLFFNVSRRPDSSATRRINHNIADLQGRSRKNAVAGRADPVSLKLRQRQRHQGHPPSF